MRKKAKFNNLSIEYYVKGQGDPLLFIHGGSLSYRAYRPFIDKLSESYTVYAPSMPGAGRSATLPRNWDFTGYIKVVKELVQHEGIYPIIAGHSLGGAISALSKATYPELFSKTFLLAPAGFKVNRPGTAIKQVATNKIRSLFNENYHVRKDILINTLFHPLDYARIGNIFKKLHLADQLKSIDEEITFVWGERDTIFPKDYAEKYMNLFRNKRAYWLDEGHGFVNKNSAYFVDLFRS